MARKLKQQKRDAAQAQKHREKRKQHHGGMHLCVMASLAICRLAYNLSLLTIDRVREGVGVAEPDAVRDKDAELAVDAASGAKLTVSPLTAPPCAP